MTGENLEFLGRLREQLTAHIQAQPEYLLEHDGGPEGLNADIILATLSGLDDQVDAEWRIPSALPYLLMPIREPLTLVDRDVSLSQHIPTARYELQSNWAEVRVDWLAFRDLLPDDVRPAPGGYLVTFALLRYKRRIGESGI